MTRTQFYMLIAWAQIGANQAASEELKRQANKVIKAAKDHYWVTTPEDVEDAA